MDILRLLLDVGEFDIKMRGENGLTALSWMALRGSVEGMQMLLDRGADVNALCNEDRTPLSWAAGKGQGQFILKSLLDAGVEMNLKDHQGRAPLSWAAINGGVEAKRNST